LMARWAAIASSFGGALWPRQKMGRCALARKGPRDTELKAEIGAAELNGAVAEAKAAG
jgi:hypothetical protein